MNREVGAVGEAALSLTDTGGLRLLSFGDVLLPKAGEGVINLKNNLATLLLYLLSASC